MLLRSSSERIIEYGSIQQDSSDAGISCSRKRDIRREKENFFEKSQLPPSSAGKRAMSEEDERAINEENNRFTKCMRGNPEVTMIPRL